MRETSVCVYDENELKDRGHRQRTQTPRAGAKQKYKNTLICLERIHNGRSLLQACGPIQPHVRVLAKLKEVLQNRQHFRHLGVNKHAVAVGFQSGKEAVKELRREREGDKRGEKGEEM